MAPTTVWNRNEKVKLALDGTGHSMRGEREGEGEASRLERATEAKEPYQRFELSLHTTRRIPFKPQRWKHGAESTGMRDSHSTLKNITHAHWAGGRAHTQPRELDASRS